jgi:archaellum component FlaG (FlaF/FlaG flagellin family)
MTLAERPMSSTTQPNRRRTMKILATILTVTTLIAGASVANAADRQATEAAVSYELINQPTVPAAYAQADVSHVSSRGDDFQLQGR